MSETTNTCYVATLGYAGMRFPATTDYKEARMSLDALLRQYQEGDIEKWENGECVQLDTWRLVDGKVHHLYTIRDDEPA